MKAGSILREARLAAGLSQAELAARARIRQPAVSRIERDHISPRLDTFDHLLRACGMELRLVDRAGLGVDRTLIRERLRLTPAERARLAVHEWEATRRFRRPARR
jgi:transcriptional regulator with XRE-family HTH domain